MLMLTVLLALAIPQDPVENVADPGWPKGAAALINHPSRIDWREKDGQWHSDHRGDAPLADFARVDHAHKRIVLHEANDKIGWSFMVWQPDSWERAQRLRIEQKPIKFGDTFSQLDVFTDRDVTVPEGIQVVDRRMHGFPIESSVLEGNVTDAAGMPIHAKVILQNTLNCRSGPNTVAETTTDAEGHWVIRHSTVSAYRVVAESEGHVPRVVDTLLLDGEPQWKSIKCILVRPVIVSGTITDETGKGLPYVRANFQDVRPDCGGVYEAPNGFAPITDAAGRFFALLPAGKATLFPYAYGWCGPKLQIITPNSDIALRMIRTSEVRVTVDFTGKTKPQLYRVTIEPEKDVAGINNQWAHINDDNQLTFRNVHPGRYVIRGQVEGGAMSGPVNVELESGKKSEIALKAN
jgi:Carboxypeptidase regulatory-like domain